MHVTPFPFSVVLQSVGDRLVVGIFGEVDLVTAMSIDEAVDRAIEDEWDHIVLDLRRVDFLDSAGLHLLMRLRARTRSGTRIAVTGVRPEVERVLALAELSDVLPRADAAPGRLSAAAFAERVLATRRSLELQPSA